MIDAYISQKRTEKENIYLPPESGRCYLPLLKACNPDNSKTTSYNVIMTYNPSSHVDDTQSTPLRVLFVNTLSLIMCSHVSKIIIIFRGALHELQED